MAIEIARAFPSPAWPQYLSLQPEICFKLLSAQGSVLSTHHVRKKVRYTQSPPLGKDFQKHAQRPY